MFSVTGDDNQTKHCADQSNNNGSSDPDSDTDTNTHDSPDTHSDENSDADTNSHPNPNSDPRATDTDYIATYTNCNSSQVSNAVYDRVRLPEAEYRCYPDGYAPRHDDGQDDTESSANRAGTYPCADKDPDAYAVYDYTVWFLHIYERCRPDFSHENADTDAEADDRFVRQPERDGTSWYAEAYKHNNDNYSDADEATVSE